MNRGSALPHRVRLVAGLLAATLVTAMAAVPAAASHGGGPPCAQPVPFSEVQRGMLGTGYTVVSGTTPQTFSVEVLGVLENALGPGRHMIVVDTSGPIIDRAGGIWFGMSGSPVFVDGRFLGAVAFGLSFGPSSVGGVTPAEDMLEVLNLPAEATAQAAASTRQAGMSREMRAAVAEHEGVSASEVGEFERLPLPFSVSGVSSQRLATLREAARRANLPLIPYVGSASAASTTLSPDPHLAPGDNFAAVLSYGDLTAAGVGTTSYVCEGRVLAFGHPFLLRGPVALGANTADALVIVDDPTFGPYKLAAVREAVGTVDQDRFAAIRARFGSLPPLAPITSTVKALNTGRSRTGRTDVAAQEELAFIAAIHTVGNLDVVFDQISKGSSELSFTLSGTRASGPAWTLRRDNRFTSQSDISFESVFELLSFLAVLSSNPFEEVRFTAVQVNATVEQVVRQYTIAKVLVARDGEYVETREIEVRPGDTIALRVLLTPFQSTAQVPVDLELEVPADAPAGGGVLEVTGGSGGFGGFGGEFPLECLFIPGACPGSEGQGSFDELLKALQDQPRNDELVARLRLSTEGPPPGEEPREGEVTAEPAPGEPANGSPPPPVPDGQPGGEAVVEVRHRLDRVVQGARAIPVRPAPVEPTLERIAGADRITTAVAVSKALFTEPDSASAVVVARADDYADALAAAPLAAQAGGPVLLTDRGSLPSAVAGEVRRLGVARAIVLGGPTAVSAKVVDGLKAAGARTVERLGGTTRFHTARLVAQRIGGERAFVVRGVGSATVPGWADAIAVAGLAAQQRTPILLTTGDRLPEETRRALAGRRQAVIVGGPAAVSEQVARSVAATGATVRRVAGATRYATSQAVAQLSVEGGADPTRIVFVTGRGFPDGLPAGPLAAARGAVLLLLDGQNLAGSPPAREWLQRIAGAPAVVTFVGGPKSITPEVEQQVAAILTGGGPPPEGAPPGSRPAG